MINCTIVILTLNEEDIIANCINSCNGYFQDIQIVDSGSKDKTRDIAEELGALVTVNVPKDRFIITEQRNWALLNLKAENEWIFFLDADEKMTNALANEIRVLTNTFREEIGFWVAPKCYSEGKWIKHISKYPNWHPRLVRIGNPILVGAPWETFKENKKVGRLKNSYRHDLDLRSLEHWLRKHVSYAQAESAKHVHFARKRRLRNFFRRFPFLRLLLTPPYLFIFKLGFLDGKAGLNYLRRILIYEVLLYEFMKNEKSDIIAQ